MRNPIVSARYLLLGAALAASGCGGGSSNSPAPSPPAAPPPPAPTLDPQYLASAPSPFGANCDGVAPVGTLYTNAEVEPSLAIDPLNANHFVATWQQDRWSSGGSRGILAAVSTDAGHNWTRQVLAFTRCAGGNAGNGGDYERASNAWVSIGPDATVYAAALAFNGAVLQPGSVSAILASRSTDGGASWSAPATLIRDVDNAFNDKVAVTADPVTPHFVYVVWDRLSTANLGPSYMARSSDDGATWEAARLIYDPGTNNQTIDNILVVLPNGMLVDFFVEIDNSFISNNFMPFLALVRSADNGATWSTPIKIADLLSVGTRDPDTSQPIRDSSLVPDVAVGPGGDLYIAWQDSRFSSGARDGIALSRSVDGGLTWSIPVQVNGKASVAAFSPDVYVRSDGTIGVTYYDFRDNTASTANLPTDAWLAYSANATTWSERQTAGPFDLTQAPLSALTNGVNGYFLGDSQGLQSAGTTFVPMFVQTNAGNTNNRTDVFAAPAVSVTSVTATAKRLRTMPADALQRYRASLQWQQRVHTAVTRALRARLPGAPRGS